MRSGLIASFIILASAAQVQGAIVIDYRRVAAERAIDYIIQKPEKFDDSVEQDTFLKKTPGLAQNKKFVSMFRQAVTIANQVITIDGTAVKTSRDVDGQFIISILVDNLIGPDGAQWHVPGMPLGSPAPAPAVETVLHTSKAGKTPPGGDIGNQNRQPAEEGNRPAGNWHVEQFKFEAVLIAQKLAQAKEDVQAATKALRPDDAKRAENKVRLYELMLNANRGQQRVAIAKAAQEQAQSAVGKMAVDAGDAEKKAAEKKTEAAALEYKDALADAEAHTERLNKYAVVSEADRPKYYDLKVKETQLEADLAKAEKDRAFAESSIEAITVERDENAKGTKNIDREKTLAQNGTAFDQQKLAAEKKVAQLSLALDENHAKQKALEAEFAKEVAKFEVTAAKDPAALRAAQDRQKAAEQADVRADAVAQDLAALLESRKADRDTKFSDIQAYFHTGAVLSNPFKIVPDAAFDADGLPQKPGKLMISPAAETDVKAFLEFRYANRWAWNENRVQTLWGRYDGKYKHIFESLDNLKVDVQTRLGYTFSADENPTANTLVGSGDFNGEIVLGFPMIFGNSSEDVHFSVGPVVGYSVVTDQSFIKAHTRYFTGLGYTTAFRDPFGSKDAFGLNRHVLLDVRVGWSVIDTVRYAKDRQGILFDDRRIHVSPDMHPRFYRKDVDAFEAELMFPVNTSTYLIFDGRVYPRAKPGQWNLQIGITTSLDSFVKTFTK